MLKILSLPLCLLIISLSPIYLLAEDAPTEKETREVLRKAVHFFRTKCSANGGYVYRLSADLSKREGEGKVGPTTAWIQPPGTPSMGLAYLEAYQLCRDPKLKEAAIETAQALMRGQLVSGGWSEEIEFAPEDRKKFAYRVDVGDHDPGNRDKTSTFDDDKSQSAARFLMKLDRELRFQNKPLHEASRYALDSFVKAQYANGAWPQRYREFPEPSDSPKKKASFPENWPREYRKHKYTEYYTLNDNTISDLITTMLDAYDIYGEQRYLNAAKAGGEFFLLAQLPEPQPGWAQQYTSDMQPAWARKFEPPAITGGESQGVMRTLILLYRRTGEERFLKPIPRAIEYYRSIQRPDGKLARFYEIGTDRPLYFTKDYKLTYSDDDMPTHYGFIVSNKLDGIEREYQKVLDTPKEKLWKSDSLSVPRRSTSLEKRVRQLIQELDERGAWVERGELQYHGDDDTRYVIESKKFARNLVTLAGYLGTFRDQK